MADKHPPGVTVQKFTREQREAGIVPGAPQSTQSPKSVILQPNETGNPPPGQVPAGEVSEAADTSESAPPTSENVPQVVSETPSDIPIESHEVTIRGAAAIEMAKMLGLEEIWNIQTGEPLSLEDAIQNPHLAIIDFAALRESIEDYDPNAIEDLVTALPAQPIQRTQRQQETPRFNLPAGPTVSVKQYPGLIRVEVEGPVTLRKAKEGNVRILQVSYKTVQAPTGIGNAQKTVATASPVRPGQSHQVSMRNTRKRTVPRRPHWEPPTPPEENEDYEF